VSAPFDGAARSYDREFTLTPIARLLRMAVWARLDTHFHPGMRVLELGCGTGEDAVRLAQRGVRVMATDASSVMLAVTRSKAECAGVAGLVETLRLDLNALASTSPAVPYDGVFSNFGPLNCVADLGLLAAHLSAWTNSGTRVVLVLMGPFCLWEIAWHLAHAHPRAAFRRWSRRGVLAQIGAETVRVWYPSPGRLAQLFAPAFRTLRVCALGVLVPPPYLQRSKVIGPQAGGSAQPSRVSDMNGTTGDRLVTTLSRIEQHIAHRWPFNQCGDHYILELERC
jgi:SAM-dependent methyltransferase